MNNRDIVLAELAELAKEKTVPPPADCWWTSRDVYKWRAASLVGNSDIAEHEVGSYLSELDEAELVDSFFGYSDIHYRINGDGLKALEEISSRAEEEMILRVAKWAYSMTMLALDDPYRVYFWDEVPEHMKLSNVTPRAEWIEGARKAIRGET